MNKVEQLVKQPKNIIILHMGNFSDQPIK